nr:transposase [Corynebacterium auris]
MPRKSYSEEFKRDAVAMYEDTDGVSLNSVAHDLGVNRGSLAAWVTRYGTGKKARATKSIGFRADPTAREAKPASSRRARYPSQGGAVFCERDGLVIRFTFIWDHRTEFSLTRMCDVLKVQRSSYYKWKKTQAARRQQGC